MPFGRNSQCPCGSGRKYKKCCRYRLGERLPEHTAEGFKVVAGFAEIDEEYFPTLMFKLQEAGDSDRLSYFLAHPKKAQEDAGKAQDLAREDLGAAVLVKGCTTSHDQLRAFLMVHGYEESEE